MGNWGLDPDDEARRRQLAHAFVDDAAARLS
jgi:hypothetical protein